MRNPTARMGWSLAARQATFALGALALFALETSRRHPESAKIMTTIVRMWTAGVLIFYGIEHFMRPDFAPGVPSPTPTASWVPLPLVLAYVTGALLVAFGIAMLSERYASGAAARAGLLMTVLTAVLYVPPFFLAGTVGARVTAINFIFDTLLFAGMMFVISTALSDTAAGPIAESGIPVQRGAFPPRRMAEHV